MIPDSPDALLTRDAVATGLTAAGYSISAATLAALVSRGGGPPFRKFGSRPLYRWDEALNWAATRSAKAVRAA